MNLFFFHTWRVTKGVMCILKGFCRQKMCFSDCSLKPSPLYMSVSRNLASVADISAVNLIVE